MSTPTQERTTVPADTFEMRLAIARFHAGGLSADAAGRLVGKSGQTWRNWEAGVSPGAKDPAMLHYIAERLGVDEGWLRDGGPLQPTDYNGIPGAWWAGQDWVPTFELVA